MRKQFTITIEDLIQNDPSTALFLGDIGIYSFRNSLQKYPTRAFNIGILEQATIGVAAGFALQGYHPIIHTIAPFLVERALEQIKLDFGYQNLNGNFVTNGASYDYASFGCTHQCPGDVQIISSVPNSNIIIPGSAKEFDLLFRDRYQQGLNYFRLTDNPHQENTSVKFGQNLVIKTGKLATVITVGPTLSDVLKAIGDLDVGIIYCTTVQPFDSKTFFSNMSSNKIITVEPYYSGFLASQIALSSPGIPLAIYPLGVAHCFHTNYGKYEDHRNLDGLSIDKIRKSIKSIIK